MLEDKPHIAPAILGFDVFGAGPLLRSLGGIASLKKQVPVQYADDQQKLTGLVANTVGRLVEEGRSEAIPEVASFFKSEGIPELLNGLAPLVPKIMNSFAAKSQGRRAEVVDLGAMRRARTEAVADKRMWDIPLGVLGAAFAASAPLDLGKHRMRTVVPKPSFIVDFSLAVSESPPVRDALFNYFARRPEVWTIAQEMSLQRRESPMDIVSTDGRKSMISIAVDDEVVHIEPFSNPKALIGSLDRYVRLFKMLGLE